MIIERIIKQEEFTDVEKSIADYLLKNGYEVKKYVYFFSCSSYIFINVYHY